MRKKEKKSMGYLCDLGEEDPPFPNVFLDISTETTYLGRIIIHLYADCPITSENFRCLCTGEKGKGLNGHNLHYKGLQFHRILTNILVQSGDIVNNNGTGGESIYGPFFKDENYWHKHDTPYKVAMANLGKKDTNSSQFYITSMRTPWLDGMHVVFGELVKGIDVVQEI